MINIDTAAKEAVKRIKKLTPPNGLEIMSYKRNRGVSVLILDNDTVRVIQRGYGQRDETHEITALPRLLKSIFKTEFPRSRKVRMYNIPGPEAIGREMKKL